MLIVDELVKIIKGFCEGDNTFDELPDEAKKVLLQYEYVNCDGEFTDSGKLFRKVVTAKPGSNPDPRDSKYFNGVRP